MRTQALILFLLAGTTLIAACGDEQRSGDAALKPVPVRVTEARSQAVEIIVEAPGTVQPRNRVVLAAQINGFVRETRVRAGDRVKAGQLLLILDARDAENQKSAAESSVIEAQAALSEARRGYDAAVDMRTASNASMELANQTFSRYRKLFESKSVSPQEMDEIRMRRDAAEAELASRESMVAAAEERIKQVEAKISQAKAQSGRADVLLSYTRILAPESGIVTERSVDAGSAIFPGSPLIAIDTIAGPQVLGSLPVEQAANLRTGMDCRLRSSSSSPLIQGRVSEIVPRSDPATHSVEFKVDLEKGASVVHGEFMKVEIPAGTRDALLIERDALVRQGQLEGLFVVDSDKTARFRLVKTAPYNSEKLEILSGIQQGETIVIRSDSRIKDGTKVEIEL